MVRTPLVPLRDAHLTEQLPTVVALHRLTQDIQTDSTRQRVFQLLLDDA